jgi:hypothetical protein
MTGSGPRLDLLDHRLGEVQPQDDGWVMDPADYTSRSEEYFDNYEGNGIPLD